MEKALKFVSFRDTTFVTADGGIMLPGDVPEAIKLGKKIRARTSQFITSSIVGIDLNSMTFKTFSGSTYKILIP